MALEEPTTYPRPTVREAMGFGGFARAQLLGGAGGLDRTIEWVRLMETPETVRVLRKGDLLLTTAFSIKDDRRAQIDLVDGVARAEGAGLVVKPERYLKELPPEMRAEADRLDLPLFELEDAVPFVDVMEPLLERIINAEHWRLKRSLDIHSQPRAEELAYMAVEQAALVVALALTKEREVAEVESRVRGEFLDDLVAGTYGDEAAAQRRARHLGYPLQGTHILMAVDVDDFRGFHRARQISEDAIQALKRELFRRVAMVVKASHQRALLSAHSDSVYALLPLGLGADHPDAQRRAHQLGQQVQEAVAGWKPGFTVSVGLSAAIEAPLGVAGAHREVTAVMETLGRLKRWSQVVSVPQLGVTGLLAGVDHERLLEFAQRHLGPLIEHDRARSGDLVETLTAYLEAGEQQAAAKRLRIHPNTLRYRLDRVREISGAEFEDPETRLNLSVAVRVQGLLGL